MPLQTSRHGREEEKEGTDWEIVTADWWRTPFPAVPWAYGVTQDPADSKRRGQYRGSLFLGSLSLRMRRGDSSSMENGGDDDDVTLNMDLVGVRGALEAVLSYERNVGFYYEAFPNIEPRELEAFTPVDLSTKVVTVEETKVHQERWNELLENLMQTPLSETNDRDDLDASFSSIEDLLHRSNSALPSLDLASSDISLDSAVMPSTPKAKSSSYHHVEIKGVSPTGSLHGILEDRSLSPGRSLNASASSFVPTFSSPRSLTDEPVHFPSLRDTPASPSSMKVSSLRDFTFPTLNPPTSSSSTSLLASKPKKDNPNFFGEGSLSSTPSLLPPFLQEQSQRTTRTRKSRTREIVDRLRSESSPNEDSGNAAQKPHNTVSPKFANYSSGTVVDDLGPPLVIQPRRSVSEDGSGEHSHHHRSSLSSTSLSASASVSASTSGLSTPEAEEDDGWIDVAHPSSPLDKEKSKRTRELFMALTKRRTDSVSSEGWKEVMNGSTDTSAEASMEASLASLPSPPRTPPPSTKQTSVTTATSPAPVTTSDGWIESSGTLATPMPEQSPKVAKDKGPRKDSHHRKKSSAHDRSAWNRATIGSGGAGHQHHQHHGLNPQHHPHPQHSHHLSMPSFAGSSSTPYPLPHPHPVSHMHPHPHSQMVPTTASGQPYFFPAYTTIAMPVPPVAYPPPYTVMHVPAAYPTAPGQAYVTPPATAVPAGYGHVRVNSLNVTQMKNNVGVAGMPMPVPVGAGYGGVMRGKGPGGMW